MIYSTNTTVCMYRPGITLESGIDLLSDAGFPAIDMTFSKYDYTLDDDATQLAAKLRRRANERGVIFNQAHAPCGGGYDKYTGETVPNLARVFEFASILGIKNIVVHPLQRGRYYGNEEELFEMNMEFYSSLAPVARNCGLRIAIENMWQYHPVTGAIVDDVCANPHELVRYYDTLSDPSVFTVCLDIGHVGLCGREAADAIRIIGHDRLGALHVHDNDYIHDTHTLPGQGDIDWDSVCRALGEIDYSGEFTLEVLSFAKKYPNSHLPRALSFMSSTAKYYADLVDSYRVKGE